MGEFRRVLLFFERTYTDFTTVLRFSVGLCCFVLMWCSGKYLILTIFIIFYFLYLFYKGTAPIGIIEEFQRFFFKKMKIRRKIAPVSETENRSNIRSFFENLTENSTCARIRGLYYWSER